MRAKKGEISSQSKNTVMKTVMKKNQILTSNIFKK